MLGTIAMLQMKKSDCKVCTAGLYQNDPGSTQCKSCPAGTMRAYDVNNDATSWDGQTTNSNRLVADTSNDCIDCSRNQITAKYARQEGH